MKAALEHAKELTTTSNITRPELIKAWRDEICKKADFIDPEGGEGRDWESLFIGFCLGKGLSIKDAIDYSFYIDEAFPFEVDPNKEVPDA